MKTLIRLSPVTLAFLFFFQTNAQITYQSAFPNIDFEFPVEIQSPLDGTDRMFVVEQPGRIKVFPRDSNVMPSEVSTFLNIITTVSYGIGQELGLLGLAFHPDYSNNGYIYVYYTTDSPLAGISVRMVLSRFTVSSSDVNQIDPSSELIIFQFDKNQNNSNHNGGKIAFGPDNYLYISIGDGGGADDPQGNGQNTNTVFSSICRIDVDIDGNNPIETNTTLPDGNYEIPSDNPFVGVDGLDEVYAYGIRNTWKFSFDAPTGRLWGADVGQDDFEEINLVENGKNYGWSRLEGNSVINPGVIITGPIASPIFSYDRTQGDVSITGGYVYRGSEITSISPDITTKYIFGDYVSGRVWALDYNASTGNATSTLLFKTTGQFISSFGVDKDGEMYFSDYGTNAKLYKLVDGTTPPSGTAVNGLGIWKPLDEGVINGQVQAIAMSTNGNIFHGGSFSQVGTIIANNIAFWNNTTGWNAMGNGTNGTVNDLKIASNGNLYIGGSFTEIDGVTANNIAMWNGTTWSALGQGVSGSILALEVDSSNNVYVAGAFETAGGITTRNIAYWNGTNWLALTDVTNIESGTNNEIRSLALDTDGTLYAGGNFDEAGGNTANRIATWDGSNWGTLGTGTSGFVESICTTATDVYIGGNFAIAGGLTVSRIARWEKSSSTWNSIGNGVSNNVNTLIHDNTYLYAAGTFDIAFSSSENIIVNNIARWSPSTEWEALGLNTQVGVDIKINDIEFSVDADGIDKICVVGNFQSAGSISANDTALWLSDNLLSIDDINQSDNILFYPNPTNGVLNLSKVESWVLTNNLGQVIETGESSILDLSNYTKGIYFLNINDKTTVKIIKR